MDEKEITLRPFSSQLNTLSKPDGSVLFNQGNTSVLTAIYGPGDVSLHKELCDRATVELLFKPKVGLPTCSSRLFEEIVRKSCESGIKKELHPRCAINIIVQELQNHGSLLACCINCATLCLLDGGIPMDFTVAAVQCAVNSEDDIILDPSLKEEEAASASFLFVFESKNFSIISVESSGVFSKNIYEKSRILCSMACHLIFDYFREAMTKKLIHH